MKEEKIRSMAPESGKGAKRKFFSCFSALRFMGKYLFPVLKPKRKDLARGSCNGLGIAMFQLSTTINTFSGTNSLFVSE